MTENLYACVCGFKCVESQLAKSQGACPSCGKRSLANKEKYQDSTMEQTNIHNELKMKKVN